MFSFLNGGSLLTKIISVGVLLLSLAGVVAGLIHLHDNRVRAELQVAQDAKIRAQQDLETAATIAELTAAVRDAKLRADQLSSNLAIINALPITTGCVQSPAIGEALKELGTP